MLKSILLRTQKELSGVGGVRGGAGRGAIEQASVALRIHTSS